VCGNGNGVVSYSVLCEVSGGETRGGAMRGCGLGTHRDERETAARGDRDVIRAVELRAGAGAVAEASGAAASERGGRPGGDVDAADVLVSMVLRGIREAHAERGINQWRGGHHRRGKRGAT
jgi:hypothetical protein